MDEFIDLKEFVPETIVCNDGKGQTVKLNCISDENSLQLSYITDGPNNSKRDNHLTIPRFIAKNERTFEVLGLLQAEMGKTMNGNLSFCNHEYNMVNMVIKWFEKEFGISKDIWRWSVKLNLLEPQDLIYKAGIEKMISDYWLKNGNISESSAFPKRITYVKTTEKQILENHNYGTLVIEYRNTFFSQIIKNLVKAITYTKILGYNNNLIRGFMRGVIAGEGSIDCNPKDGRYTVHISATVEEERMIYKACLSRLSIFIKIYQDYKEMLISRKENLLQLLNQRLMTLSHEKYNKFRNMMKNYNDVSEITDYYKPKGENVWNKTPEHKILDILRLYKEGITKTKDIAEELGLGLLKVQRVLKENNLGNRVCKIDENKRKEIAKFASDNQKLTCKEIGDMFKVSESAVLRACNKYGVEKKNLANYTIPEEKIQKIIQMYKDNPEVKFTEIMKEVGVSDSVIQRVRRENKLEHLGFKHLVGNNNKKVKHDKTMK